MKGDGMDQTGHPKSNTGRREFLLKMTRASRLGSPRFWGRAAFLALDRRPVRGYSKPVMNGATPTTLITTTRLRRARV